MYEKADIIGQEIKIVKSTNKFDEKIEGCVLWETKNMLHIKTDKKIVKLCKYNIIFTINNMLIIGATINNKIYERKTLCKWKITIYEK